MQYAKGAQHRNVMIEYRFHLQKYQRGSKTTCPHCERKNCFTRYIDEEGRIEFPSIVGKCDHENSCGYHYSPKDYFKDHPVSDDVNDWQAHKDPASHSRPAVPKPTSYIDESIMLRSMTRYDINPLYQYVAKVMGDKEAMRLLALYHVGTSSKWGGSTVYWQVDSLGRIRTGKVMLYDAKTGHRIKEPRGYVSWAHAEMKLPDFQLKQCFFGEHLLSVNPSSKVMIVESEKTAIIGKYFMPDYVWLATGGKNGCFNQDAVQVLKDRTVMLLPDLGATEKWQAYLPMLEGICHSASVSTLLEEMASEEQRKAGLDIADFLLMEDTKQMILQKMIARNPCLQKLIDALGLEVVDD